MKFKLPTVEIKIGSRDVQTPDTNGVRRDLGDLDLRGKASDLREVATSGVSSLREAAASGASTLMEVASDAASSIRDKASAGASDLKDRASEVNLPSVDLAPVKDKLPSMEMPAIDVAKAVAPAAKAVGGGIEAVADSFRSVRKGINDWRNPPKQQPPVAEAGVALLAGVGGGMALMYFLDPKQGHRRRTLLLARLDRWTRTAGKALQGTLDDIATRSQALTGSRFDDDDAETQMDILTGPDASTNLEEIDRAAGREPGEPFTGSTDATATGYVSSSGTESGASPEIYGQGWGETGSATNQDMGSFADAEVAAEEERDRVGSSSES